VGGHWDLPAGGHQVETVAVTDGERRRALPPCEVAAERRICAVGKDATLAGTTALCVALADNPRSLIRKSILGRLKCGDLS
jgi:hypothetical protein